MAIGALVPLVVSRVAMQIVIASCCGGGTIVDVLSAGAVHTDAIEVQVGSDGGSEDGGEEDDD